MHLPSTVSVTADLPEVYSFPTHIVQADLQPDIVLWDDTNKSLTLIELTILFETGLTFEAAQQRKENKYLDILLEDKKVGYTSCTSLSHWRWVLGVYHTFKASKYSNTN